MRVGLELLRIIVIFGLLGALGYFVLENVYTINETTQSSSWLGAFAILVLLFVFYRNKLQFFGWYKDERGKKLPGKVSATLISISVILFISPFVLASLLN